LIEAESPFFVLRYTFQRFILKSAWIWHFVWLPDTSMDTNPEG
jgi:hypothetical protein